MLWGGIRSQICCTHFSFHAQSTMAAPLESHQITSLAPFGLARLLTGLQSKVQHRVQILASDPTLRCFRKWRTLSNSARSARSFRKLCLILKACGGAKGKNRVANAPPPWFPKRCEKFWGSRTVWLLSVSEEGPLENDGNMDL